QLAPQLLRITNLVFHRVGVALQLIPGINALLQLPVFISEVLRIIHHALDVLRSQAVLVIRDGNLVLVASAFVLCCYLKDATSIDFKGYFNLWDTSRCLRDSREVKSAQQNSNINTLEPRLTYIFLSRENTSMHSCSVGHSFIWVDAPRGLLAIEKLLHQLLDLGDTGCTYYVEVLKLGTERLDLNAGLVLGGQRTFGFLHLTPQLLHGTVVPAHIFACFLLVQLDEVLHDTLVKVLTPQMGVPIGGHHLKHTIVNGEERHIKGATT
ncbi:hypothetical protein Z043_111912, partial [Scleropages formosus]